MSNGIFKSVFFTGIFGYLSYVGLQQVLIFTNPLSTAGRIATFVAPIFSAKILGFTPTVARKIESINRYGSKGWIYPFSIIVTSLLNTGITAAITTYEKYETDDIKLFSIGTASTSVFIGTICLIIEHLFHQKFQEMKEEQELHFGNDLEVFSSEEERE